MRIDRRIALRYLFAKKRMSFIGIISWISVIGVTVGVAALVIVLSVFNGFSSLVTEILVNFDPHIRIEPMDESLLKNTAELEEYLKSNQRVSELTPYLEGKAVFRTRTGNKVIRLKGVRSDPLLPVPGIGNNIVLGAGSIRPGNVNSIIIGMTFADRSGSVIGDTLLGMAPPPGGFETLYFSQPAVKRFVVTGIYESSNKEYDQYYAFTDIESARALFGFGDGVSGIDVRLKDFKTAEAEKQKLVARFGTQYGFVTWFDLHTELYAVMKIEHWAAYIILALIIGIATFNLLGFLTITVIEKKRDIGVIRSMGATSKMVRNVFVYQGLFVGLLGAGIGLLIGFALVYAQREYHLFPLDPSVYIIPAIPVEVNAVDICAISILSIGLTVLASLYPARRAASLMPAEAIRWE